MKVDVLALRAQHDIVEVIGRYLKLEKDAAEFVALCPFHDEKSPSFKVSPKKQFFQCFGCGAHGDVIDFIQQYNDVPFREAADILTGGKPPTAINPPKPRPQVEDNDKEWTAILPVPDNAPPPNRTFSKKVRGKWTPLDFIAMFPYRDLIDGKEVLLGYSVRFEWDEGDKRKKDYIPQTWCRNSNTGELKWKYLGFPKPRPLYNLIDLEAKPDAIVWIAEGEKKADAVNRMVPGVAAIAWTGGKNALPYLSYERLRGRKCLLFRDADQVGLETMDGWTNPRTGERSKGFAEYIKDIAAAVKIVDPPEGVPESWDLADAEKEGWTAERLGAHIRTHARLPICMQPIPEAKEPDAPKHAEESPPPIDYGSRDDDDAEDAPPYRALGYDKGRFYYLAGRASQVIDLASSSHTKLNLMSVAPLHYWLQRYPSSKDGNEAMWDMAANALMRQCEDVGVYDSAHVRGRGAWWDGSRSLLHIGDCLLIDGIQHPLTDPSVKYIYEAAPPLHLEIENPLTQREAVEFAKICQSLQWEKPISGMLMAGWIFLAPICGALKWRPHIWITGPAGTGKSWVQSNIVSLCVGNTAIMPQGVATEAGIRQLLGMDARPVIFDEAEGEDQHAQARIQSIMSLARQASSENGGAIVKGSANGKAITYRIRSMFCFSSIGTGIKQYADKTRVTVLSMTIDQGKSQEQRMKEFAALEAKAANLLTEEFASRLRARAVGMIGIIRENAKTFSAAGAAVIGTQRLGDQIGTMLAGAFALHNNGLVSPQDARAWIEKQDWSDQTALQEVKDEQSCLSRLLECVVRVSGKYATVERSIGELIVIASSILEKDDSIYADVAANQLLRTGIKIENDGFTVANSHTGLEEILKGTLWANEWGRILKRLDGAKSRETTRFGASGSMRGVWLPLSYVTGK